MSGSGRHCALPDDRSAMVWREPRAVAHCDPPPALAFRVDRRSLRLSRVRSRRTDRAGTGIRGIRAREQLAHSTDFHWKMPMMLSCLPSTWVFSRRVFNRHQLPRPETPRAGAPAGAPRCKPRSPGASRNTARPFGGGGWPGCETDGRCYIAPSGDSLTGDRSCPGGLPQGSARQPLPSPAVETS